MKLSKQVTSLKLSKKLKKLGAKQESVWYWTDLTGVKTKVGGRFYTTDWYITDNNLAEIDKVIFGKHYISAFLPVELGERLPEGITTEKIKPRYLCIDIKTKIEIEAKTEANARGEMLAYLILNKLITINQ